jgi:hypothetical protein
MITTTTATTTTSTTTATTTTTTMYHYYFYLCFVFYIGARDKSIWKAGNGKYAMKTTGAHMKVIIIKLSMIVMMMYVDDNHDGNGCRNNPQYLHVYH